MNHRFQVPTIKERGQLVRAIAAAQAFKPVTGEFKGRITCTRCGSGLNFSILSNGISRGQCSAAGCIRWTH